MRPIAAKTSIANLVAVVLIIVTTVVLGTFAAYNYRSEKDRRMQRLFDDHQTWTEQIASSLVLPIWNFNRQQIDNIIVSAMGDREISAVDVAMEDQTHSHHIKVRDAAGQPISADTMPVVSPEWTRTHEITFDGDVIGNVTVQVSPLRLQSNLAQTRNWMVLTIAVFDVLLTTCLYFLLKAVVLRPLTKLESHAVALSSGGGELEALEASRFTGEIERLREAVVRLVKQLRRRYSELQQASVSLQRAQERELNSREEFGVRLLNTQEQERKRIAAELHDSVGQELSLVANRAQLALNDPQLDEASARHFQSIAQSTSRAITEVRSIVRRLRPLHIEQLGFTASLEGLLDQVIEGTGIFIIRHLDNIDDLVSADRATHLYRLTQEALNNAIRHAQAQRIEVHVDRDLHSLRLTVSDNGSGFSADPDQPGNRGLGLTSMQERTKILGGALLISSSPGHGTSITVELPIRESDKDNT